MQRIRIHYSINEALRYTSTQDMHKIWERTLRRANLPMVYSQGFHPQPKIQLACPLPLGMTSQAEFIDFWLDKEFSSHDLLDAISPVLHPGIEIREIKEVPHSDPSLQSRVESINYLVTLSDADPVNGLNERLESMLSRENIFQERRGKKYDLRPLIQHCSLVAASKPENNQIIMKLSALPGATGRPEEVLKALDIDPNEARIVRQTIHFSAMS